MMRLSIVAVLGLSCASVLAQDDQEQRFIPVCENPVSIMGELINASGYVRCEDGRVLREQAVVDLPGNPGTPCSESMGDPGFSQCRDDSECTARPFGDCIVDWRVTRGGACVCEYRCMSDLDCPIGEVCLATGAAGESQKKCVRAVNCRTNDDCASGQCEVSDDYTFSMGGEITLGCRSEKDECRSDWECEDMFNSGCSPCLLDPYAGYWRCAEQCHTLGRPFLIQGEAALPSLVANALWIDDCPLSSSSLEPGLAQRVAAHWLECARMEHASVAAFARFALQLMHLGAPPELLQSTTEAMQDEIAHAKTCFALAKRYSGQTQSAGQLEVSQALAQELEPARIAVDVFLEGCVGESIAALEASEMSRLAVDPTVRGVLSKIAKDEHQHALLAWRSLGWMLQSLPGEQQREIVDALEQLLAGLAHELRGAAPSSDFAFSELEQHGVPSSQRKAALRRQALTQLVLPCAQGMLSQWQSAGLPDSRVAQARGASSFV